jgi:hypothetical protein
MYVTPTGTASITGGQITGVSGVLVKAAVWGVPVIIAGTGSMGNNGAMTLGTALGRTYSNGAWFYLPTNAIQAGSTAGFYWGVASSSTAVTIYNSTYSGSGAPTVGTTTAFVSTGPGAFTGTTTEQGILIAIPALTASGKIHAEMLLANNNSAGTKSYRFRFNGAAGTTFVASTQTTTTSHKLFGEIYNAGLVTTQVGEGRLQTSTGGWAISPLAAAAAADTSSATAIYLSAQTNTATDNEVIDAGEVWYSL